MKTKKKYIAPALKSYAYQVEVGFANSLITPDGIFHTNGIEDWEGWTKPRNDNGNFGGNGTAGSNVGEWDWDN